MIVRALPAIVLCSLAAACASQPARPDRTEGLGVEFLWASADKSRTSYFVVSSDGTFASSGGLPARQRTTEFTMRLSDDEVARFVDLVRATGFAARPRQSGESGDENEIMVRDMGKRTSFVVRGDDPTVSALHGFLREISLRQFRDVIDAQPQAGERIR